MARVCFSSMLSWLWLLGAESWRGKEGGSDLRAIFRDGSPRNFLEFKGEMLQNRETRLIELKP